MTNRRTLIASRIALVALVGVVAAVFLSSSLVAGVVAAVTITAVLVDSIAFARLPTVEHVDGGLSPRTITVDLSRRS